MRPLTPERWQQLASILDEALDLAPEARTAYLDLVCSGQPNLRAEIDAFLAADAASGDFLEHSAEAYLEMDETPSHLAAALRDRYALERELGRGGMATVYLVRDLKHERPVALKVIRVQSGRWRTPSGFTARSASPPVSSILTSSRSSIRGKRTASSGLPCLTSRARLCGTGSAMNTGYR
jgi:hypothetical protein